MHDTNCIKLFNQIPNENKLVDPKHSDGKMGANNIFACESGFCPPKTDVNKVCEESAGDKSLKKTLSAEVKENIDKYENFDLDEETEVLEETEALNANELIAKGMKDDNYSVSIKNAQNGGRLIYLSDVDGRVAEKLVETGGENAISVYTKYEYSDDKNKIDEYSVYNGNINLKQYKEYLFDENGLIKELSSHERGDYNSDEHTTYIYDDEGNLTNLITDTETPEDNEHSVMKYRSDGDLRYTEITYSDKFGNVRELSDEEVHLRNANFRYNIDVDGDPGETMQNSSGDCWLLSGVKALSCSEKGREIIDKAIEYKDNTAILHTYFGDYFISYKDVQEAKNALNYDEEGNPKGLKYASGDDDMIVFELGIEQLRNDISSGLYDVLAEDFSNMDNNIVVDPDKRNTLNGGYCSEIMYYLTGNKSDVSVSLLNKMKRLEDFTQNAEQYTLNCDFKKDITVSDVYGSNINLKSGHAYAIKSADEDTVTLSDPWDSSFDITISKDLLLSTSYRFESCDISSTEIEKGTYNPGKLERFIKQEKAERLKNRY